MKYLLILLSTFTFAQTDINVEYQSQINRINSEASENEIYILNINDGKCFDPYKTRVFF